MSSANSQTQHPFKASFQPLTQVQPASHSLQSCCERCENAFRQVKDHLESKEPKKRYSEMSSFDAPHHATLNDLKGSATSCPLCRFFLFHAQSSEASRKAIQPGWRRRVVKGPQNLLVDFWISFDENDVGRIADLRYRFSDAIGSDGVWFDVNAYGSGQKLLALDRPVASRPPLDLARKWIDDCQTSHTSLCGEPKDIKLPSRLVDIGDASTNPRLITTDDMDHSKRYTYVALSHCWGQHLPDSRTTTTNVSSYLQTIPFDSLERTFQDAIVATRDLGYRYLWLDTLCIIQDSQEDWQKECSRMADVYSNAVVTIAAAASPDAFSGILNERPQPEGPTCEISWEGVCQFSIKRSANSMNDFMDQPDSASLLEDRAWTLQERLLSPRVLHIGADRMALECRQGTEYEYARPYHRSFVHQRMTAAKIPWLTRDPESSRFFTGELDSVTRFYDLASEYTKCSLAHRDDILPAFSGIAKRYHEWSGDEYLAGLWRKTLIQGLCWERSQTMYMFGFSFGLDKIKDGMATRDSKAKYSVPSWSWASLNKQINYRSTFQDQKNVVYTAEVADAKVNLVGHDPFGQVNGGEVVLRSFTRTYRFGMVRNLPRRFTSLFSDAQTLFTPWFAYISDDPAGPAWGQQVTVLLLGETSYTSNEKLWEHWNALVLQSVDNVTNKFRRVGLAVGRGKASWLREGEMRTIRII